MLSKIRTHLPLVVTLGGFALLLALLLLRSRPHTQGRQTYALDDAYIHLVLARNLAENVTFGINPGEFAAASSSPLWTLLLAASMKVVGARNWLPGAWAALFAMGTLVLVDRLGRSRGLGGVARTATGLAVLYLTPLAVMVVSGMEHTAHLFFALLLAGLVARWFDDRPPRSAASACIVAFLSTGLRYESLFLAAPLSAFLFLRGRQAAGTALALSALLPVVLFGLYSQSQGGFFLPNSLLLKAHFPHFDSLRSIVDALGFRGFGKLIDQPHVLHPVLLLLLGACMVPSPRGGLFWCGLAVPIATLLHAQFASFGWFYRYEAWLIGLSIPFVFFALTPALRGLPAAGGWDALGRNGALAAALVLLVWPLHRRAWDAHGDTPLACRHIDQQQRQLAAFFHSSFPAGTKVAVNDIGAVALEGGCRVLDLWGLGNTDVTAIRRSRRLTADDIDGLLLSHQARFAAVYDELYPHRPASMIPVAQWRLRLTYFVPLVTFYAIGPENVAPLEAALRAFPLSESTELTFRHNPGPVPTASAAEPAPPQPPVPAPAVP